MLSIAGDDILMQCVNNFSFDIVTAVVNSVYKGLGAKRAVAIVIIIVTLVILDS